MMLCLESSADPTVLGLAEMGMGAVLEERLLENRDLLPMEVERLLAAHGKSAQQSEGDRRGHRAGFVYRAARQLGLCQGAGARVVDSHLAGVVAESDRRQFADDMGIGGGDSARAARGGALCPL